MAAGSGSDTEWKRHRFGAHLVAAAVVVLPVLAACAGAALARAALSSSGTVVVWIGALAAAAVAYLLAERAGRRLLPLSLLLQLSLVFPDRAPSRMRIALRAGSTKRLLDSGHPAGPAAAGGAEEVLALAASLATHDRATRGHSERVRAYAEMLADELGLDEHDHDCLRWAALLHDVGKLAVPASILNATSPLSDEDWATIQRHPIEGARLTQPLEAWLGSWATAVAQHHERYAARAIRTACPARSSAWPAASSPWPTATTP